MVRALLLPNNADKKEQTKQEESREQTRLPWLLPVKVAIGACSELSTSAGLEKPAARPKMLAKAELSLKANTASLEAQGPAELAKEPLGDGGAMEIDIGSC